MVGAVLGLIPSSPRQFQALLKNNRPIDFITTIHYNGIMNMNRKEVIEYLIDIEMRDVKQMRKINLRGLVRELLEDKMYEMTDEALADYYYEVTQ